MTGLEIVLLIIGAICISVSFLFFSKNDPNEAVSTAKINTELTEAQKDDVRRQIREIFREESADLSEKTEISLEKLSNQKIKELSEYSETVLTEINKTHDKVIFLYDMLTEKTKEVNSTVRDMTIAREQLEKAQSEQAVASEPAHVGLQEYIDNTASTPKPRTRTKKKAAPAKDVEEYMTELMEDSTGVKVNNRKNSKESANRNQQIIDLDKAGMSELEIAKDLNIGIGEVKLVLELFKGKQS